MKLDDSLPHVRGGVSFKPKGLLAAHPSSPRTWGCFRTGVEGDYPEKVFPTYVGVFLDQAVPSAGTPSLPHVRGGVSEDALHAPVGNESSPRTWGCF